MLLQLSFTETLIWTLNCLVPNEVNYMEKNPGMFSSKTLISYDMDILDDIAGVSKLSAKVCFCFFCFFYKSELLLLQLLYFVYVLGCTRYPLSNLGPEEKPVENHYLNVCVCLI